MTGAAVLVPWLVGGAILAPLLLAALVVAWPRWAQPLVVAGPVCALLAASLLAVGVSIDVPWLLFGARFGLDDTGRVLLVASAAVWQIAALHAATGPGLRGPATSAGFLMAMAGNFGVVLAQDAASFFACFALMSFSAYLLVVERGGPAARRAGRVYIALVILGEVLILSGLLTAAAGSTVMVQGFPLPALLLWLGFGIKAGLVPLHASLPLAYGAASTAGVLALAGAMVNAGLLGWLRFLPAGDPAAADLGFLMMGCGLAGAVYGVVVGLAQTDARVLLGYSSVSQMGLIAVGVGAGLAVPQAWPDLLGVVLLYAVHHAFAKAALFGALDLPGGAGSRLRQLALLVPAAALIGLPFTSGELAKAALKGALPVLPVPWPEILAAALFLATVGTTLLMARLLVLASRLQGDRGQAQAPIAPALLLLAVLASVWWLPVLVVPLGEDARAGVSGLGVPWPAVLGAAIAAAAYGLGRFVPPRWRVPIPPGDLVVPVERLVARLWRVLEPVPEGHHHGAPEVAVVERRRGRLTVGLARAERAVARWEVAGVMLIALAVVVTLLVLWGSS